MNYTKKLKTGIPNRLYNSAASRRIANAIQIYNTNTNTIKIYKSHLSPFLNLFVRLRFSDYWYVSYEQVCCMLQVVLAFATFFEPRNDVFLLPRLFKSAILSFPPVEPKILLLTLTKNRDL
jgi:hypothetical protein